MTAFTGKRLHTAVVFAVVVLFAWTHRGVLTLPGFAEDLTLQAQFMGALEQGSLWRSQIFPRIVGPLWGEGNLMWRPWGVLSLGLDVLLFGDNVGTWRITNLALHLANAALCGLLAFKLTTRKWTAIVAFATFLLNPWSAEITIWIVGRFDGWATFGMLASVVVALNSAGRAQGVIASSVLALVAYLSKESALLLLPLLTLVLWAQAVSAASLVLPHQDRFGMLSRFVSVVRQHKSLLSAHLAVTVGYLVVRYFVVGQHSADVYGSFTSTSVLDFFSRVCEQLVAFGAVADTAPSSSFLAGVTLICASLASLAHQWRDRCLAITSFVSVAWIAIVIAALAYQFPKPIGLGDGARFFYFPAIGIAIFAGVAYGVAAELRRGSLAIALLSASWIAALASWQSAANSQWRVAGEEIESMVEAISAEWRNLGAGQTAFVVLPDPLNRVIAFRNAQPGLTSLARQRAGIAAGNSAEVYLFVTWEVYAAFSEARRLGERKQAVAELTPHKTFFFCKPFNENRLKLLGFWTNDSKEDWRIRWIQYISDQCPYQHFKVVI